MQGDISRLTIEEAEQLLNAAFQAMDQLPMGAEEFLSPDARPLYRKFFGDDEEEEEETDG